MPTNHHQQQQQHIKDLFSRRTKDITKDTQDKKKPHQQNVQKTSETHI